MLFEEDHIFLDKDYTKDSVYKVSHSVRFLNAIFFQTIFLLGTLSKPITKIIPIANTAETYQEGYLFPLKMLQKPTKKVMTFTNVVET